MQSLGACAANYFKVLIRVTLPCDISVATKDASLIENTFGPGVGGFKFKTGRPRHSPIKIQVKFIPQELFSLCEELSLSLDRSCASGQMFVTVILHESRYETAILINVACKQLIMKVEDGTF